MRRRLLALQKNLYFYSLMIWRSKAFWTRAVLCWFIGCALFMYDEASNFDLRQKIRGARSANSEIVIIDINERDWGSLDPETRNVLRPLKEVLTPSDAFFWNARIWEGLLSKIIAGEPAAVGVTFFFGENIRSPQLTAKARELFENPLIVWGAEVDNSGRMLIPQFATMYNGNVGLRGLRADDDGSVRRISSSSVQVPHLAVRVGLKAHPEASEWVEKTFSSNRLINFSGNGETSFLIVNGRDLFEGRVHPSFLKNKVLLIGNLSNSLEQVQTPLGRMSRTEAIANVVDNIISQSTIILLPRILYLALLALLMAGAIWILAHYPQSVTLVFFLLVSIAWVSLSVWMFDGAHIWLPVLSPIVQLLATCIVFLSYQLAINERRTWSLEQEQKYRDEIERLKTNFVSMMSHDLKTPIAKIQAICDRLLLNSPESTITPDLKSLRRSSDELHRYIQSILQVTKVEAKDFQIKTEVTDINEDIERVMARLQPLASEKQIQITLKLEPMFSIEVDTTLIQEVIHNLVENAIKYTPPGGSVTITSEEKDDFVSVVIEDTGPGIAPEEQADIWRKFTRGRNLTTGGAGEIKGTGLGLYLVKYFVELHRGQVFLESKLGVGTRIGFQLPLSSEESTAEKGLLA